MRPRAGKLALALSGSLAALATATVASQSQAQRVVDQALTVVVGRAEGGAVTERLDARRSNASSALLPTGSLRVVWTRQLHAMSHAPLVTSDGTVIAVSDMGEALFLHPDGTDAGRTSVGPGPMSAPILLPDGTLMVVNGLGDVVAVRRMEVVFRTHVLEPSTLVLGSSGMTVPLAVRSRVPRRARASSFPPQREPRETRAWALPLDDGGLVVAFEKDLVSLDASGVVRARAIAPAVIASPLVAMATSVAFVGESGEVYDWDLTSAAGAVRTRGSFGGTVEGGISAVDGRHLIAVVHGARVVSFDLRMGVAETRATASGAFSGEVALTPGPDPSSPVAFVQEVTPLGTRVLEIEADGQATPFSILLTPLSSLLAGDAGSPGAPPDLRAQLLAPIETQLFADPTGSLAYATVDGHVGVITKATKHELGPLPCGSPMSPAARSSAATQGRFAFGFAGLAPAGPGAFVVACEAGAVSLVRGETQAPP